MSCCSACGQHACACGCGAGTRTPRSLYNRPGLDSLVYRVGTYTDFRATMQLDLSDAALPALAALRTRELDDPSMALLDAWAVGADVLSFYQERIANEGYLRTATERCSVLQLGRLVDYRLRPGVAASVYLAYTIDDNSPSVTIPVGAKAQSVPAPGEQMQTFETAEPLEARSAWNGLKPRLTQPQDISLHNVAGLGEIWVASISSNLKANDRLLFQFGTGADSVSAVRLVQSVEVQQRDQRSRVVLQAMDPVTAQIVAAAYTVLAAGAGSWQQAIELMRQQLLLGRDNGGSYTAFKDIFQGMSSAESGPPPLVAFMQTVANAFNGGVAVPSPVFGDFGALFGALTLALLPQPANSLRLQRSVATALGISSDTRPQLLLNFATPLVDTFYNAWTQVPHGDPSPTLNGVFAMRLSAPLFGYNAPQAISITQKWDGANSQWVSTSTPGGDPQVANESKDVLSLDNAYDSVTAGGYVLIQNGDDARLTVGQITSARILPRSDYGISGKTTKVHVTDPSGGGATVWQAPTNFSVIRSTQIYAQSELLPLASLVITDDVGNATASATASSVANDSATRVTLDTPVDGLKSGRWVIVQGQRSDVPGTTAVTAAELVMLAAVEQGVVSDLSGDTVHSTLVFANKGLAYRYQRDTVTIYANVVRATNGETRQEVLGYGNGAVPMQRFALKQSPLTYVSAATVDGVQCTLMIRVNGMQWHEVRNLAFADAGDRSFVTATDDTGKTSVTFGDGAHGSRLPTGIENVAAVYRNGIGTPGNVKAGQISLLTTKPLGVKNVINPLRASGGADAETRDQARNNVPLAVLALDRLVSVPDYADFARTFGGVGKAVAVKLGAQVRVTIAGAADAPVDPTSDLYRNLLQALQKYGDPSLPVGLDVRQLLSLTLSAKVGLATDYGWETVAPLVRATLLDRFGFERRGLARNVYLSEIVACIQSVRGVAWVDVDAFGYLDEKKLLEGFGVRDPSGNEKGTGESMLAVAPTTPAATLPNAVAQRVQALPARYDSDGNLLPAQLAYFLPTVPDTLLLQEATP